MTWLEEARSWEDRLGRIKEIKILSQVFMEDKIHIKEGFNKWILKLFEVEEMSKSELYVNIYLYSEFIIYEDKEVVTFRWVWIIIEIVN